MALHGRYNVGLLGKGVVCTQGVDPAIDLEPATTPASLWWVGTGRRGTVSCSSPDSSMGSLSTDLRTWSDSPVSELSSILRSLPWMKRPSAGRRSPDWRRTGGQQSQVAREAGASMGEVPQHTEPRWHLEANGARHRATLVHAGMLFIMYIL